MKYWILALIVLVFGSGLCLAQTETETRTLVFDQIERTYELFVPESFDPEQPASLLMVLHGGGDTAQGMIPLGFNELMVDFNGIVVYPNGLEKRWNDGRVRNDGREKIDDAGFLVALIETLADEYNVTAGKAYVTGFSNGSIMSYRLACEYPERVAAIATVAGLYPATLDCTPDQPVAVLSVVGDEDPLIPLAGGDMFYGEYKIGTVLSLETTVDLWRKANACPDDDTETIAILNADPGDDTRIIRHRYGDCEPPVVFYVVRGGGHTWPGTTTNSPEDLYGRTSHDMETAAEIVAFFVDNGLGASVPAN